METDITPTDQTFVTGSHAVSAGTVIGGRWRTDNCLASGGYGDVWRGVDVETGTPIAVKVLRTDAGNNDPSAIARMRQEAEILMAMNHPNIVRVFDFGESPYGHFIAMEFLDGLAIDQWLTRKGPISPDELVPYAQQLLAALGQAHAKRILHRDLKPENIILLKDATQRTNYRAVLVDFGIAKAQQLLNDHDQGATLVQTRAGGFMGTPRYAAPEQAVGDPCGDNIDLFALGLVLAEWLTGRMRIDGERHSDVMTQLLSPDPIDVSDVPERWRPWLQRMLYKNPLERFQSAAEALDALGPLVIDRHEPADFVDREAMQGFPPPAQAPGGFVQSNVPIEVDFDRVRQMRHPEPPPSSRPAEPTIPQPMTPALPPKSESVAERDTRLFLYLLLFLILFLIVLTLAMFDVL